MIKKLIFICLFFVLIITNKANAQSIEGNWYTPIRNKLLHLIITKDSILLRKCSFDTSMQDYGYLESGYHIEKKIKNAFIVKNIKDSMTNFYLVTFKSENEKNLMNIQSFSDTFSTIAEAEKAIDTFQKNPLSVTFLNKENINKIRSKKPIETITLEEFKTHIINLIALDSTNKTYAKKKFKFNYLYIESTERIMYSELGFNSLVKGFVIDAIFRKYYEFSEIKTLIEGFNK